MRALAQMGGDGSDPLMRIERLENQLRQLTGQNEELQHRNRLLEEQLRQLQGGGAQPAPGQRAQTPAPGMTPGPVNNAGMQPNAPYQPPQQQAQPPMQQPSSGSQAAAPVVAPQARGDNGDAFDPNRNPSAPGVPRALGGGQLPMSNDGPVAAPGGRNAGEPLDLSSRPGGGMSAPAQGYPQQGYPQQGNAQQGAGLTTLPPSATPRDEFDLGIGYIQRKDYALAEETMRNFTQKYPSDRLTSDAQYWLGESLFQRQKYREAAESFLAVTTKYDKSAKAPDALLRLGQSLAALKEKEAACAAFGEITRKYPQASSGVKRGVAREQKRVGC
jgi:tol-pal system protein YbgF